MTGEPQVPWEVQFFHRVLRDAYLEAAATYWLRRASDFEMVGTPACDEIAMACRNRASLGDISAGEFDQALHDWAKGFAA